MSEFDDLLQNAWQTARPPGNGRDLARRVQRVRWRRRLWRGFEVALTLVAIGVLARPLFGHAATPSYWLVMPFFLVYLPTIWWLLLRNPQPLATDTARDGRAYAQIRLFQLRAGLRELRIARIASNVLLAYAVAAAIGAFASGDAAWRGPALQLLAYGGACVLATFWLSRRQRRHRLREYRAIRRLIGRTG